MSLLDRLVDLFKGIDLHQPVNGEPPVMIIFYQLGNEVLGNRVALQHADQRLSVAHQLGLHIDGQVAGGTHDHAGAVKITHSKGLADAFANAGRVDGIIDAAVGQPPHGSHFIALLAVHGMGRAQLLRQLQAVGIAADGDDLGAACDLHRHDGAHANGSVAVYSNGGTKLRAQTVQDGSRAGLDPAANGRDDAQVDVIVLDLDRASLIHDRVCRKGGLAEEGGQCLPVQRLQTAGAVRLNAAEVDLIQVLAARAGSAIREHDPHTVTGLKFRNADADLFNDACALMPQNRGQRNRNELIPAHQIRMADAAGNDPDKDLVKLRLRKLYLFNNKRSALRMGHSCFDFHRCILLFIAS